MARDLDQTTHNNPDIVDGSTYTPCTQFNDREKAQRDLMLPFVGPAQYNNAALRVSVNIATIYSVVSGHLLGTLRGYQLSIARNTAKGTWCVGRTWFRYELYK